MLQKGDQLPNIILKNEKDEDVSLTSFLGKPLVVFFYPKDNTKVCTAQACGFRDHFDEYLTYEANIIGISKDSPASHAKVINKRKLPFPLLSDGLGKARKAFKVSSYLFGSLVARSTFVIDKKGIIQYSFREDFNADKHIKKSLEVLSKLD